MVEELSEKSETKKYENQGLTVPIAYSIVGLKDLRKEDLHPVVKP